MNKTTCLPLGILALFLASYAFAAENVTFAPNGPFTTKTDNLAQDTINALNAEYITQDSGNVQALLNEWDAVLAQEPWGQSFIDSLTQFGADMANVPAADHSLAISGWVNDSLHFDDAGNWVGNQSPQPIDAPEVILEDGGPGDSFEVTVANQVFTVTFVPEDTATQNHVLTNTATALKDLLAAETAITAVAELHQEQNAVILLPKDGEPPLQVSVSPNDDGNQPTAAALAYNPGDTTDPTLPHPLSPVVSNVTAAQVAGTKHMEVFFDLAVEDNHPCTIIVKWSTDNGATYPMTATAVVGQVGPGILPGNAHKITWDMEIDWKHQFTQSGRIKVIASRDPIDDTIGTDTDSTTDGSTAN